MNHNSYIHDQLTTARRRDLLEAAEQARLAAQARRRPGARSFRPSFRWWGRRRYAVSAPSLSTSNPSTATR